MPYGVRDRQLTDVFLTHLQQNFPTFLNLSLVCLQNFDFHRISKKFQAALQAYQLADAVNLWGQALSITLRNNPNADFDDGKEITNNAHLHFKGKLEQRLILTNKLHKNSTTAKRFEY